jgi:hypothetical protein
MARSPSRTVSGSQQNRKYAPPKPATQPYIEDADADADVDPEFELSDDDEANLEAIPRSQTVNIPGDDDEDENVIGQGEHEREQNEEGLDQDGQYEDDLDEDVRSNAHVTVNNSPNRASPPGARRANHDNGRRERVYARNETPVWCIHGAIPLDANICMIQVQDMPLFTLEGTNRPAAFAFHKKISADQRRALRGRIEVCYIIRVRLLCIDHTGLYRNTEVWSSTTSTTVMFSSAPTAIWSDRNCASLRLQRSMWNLCRLSMHALRATPFAW